MKIRFDHINMSVLNLAESIDWYQRVFGMEVLKRGSKPTHDWAIIGRDDTMVAMNEFPNGGRVDGLFSGTALEHIGIRVDDEAAWRKIVEDNNLELFYGGVNEYAHSRSWYVRDPSGHTIEVSYSDTPTLTFPPLQA